jgi:hypothetical protein
VKAKYLIRKAVTTEVVEAEGWSIEHGGVLALTDRVEGRRSLVKAFAPGHWVSVEPAKATDA